MSVGTTPPSPAGLIARARGRLPSIDSAGDVVLYVLCGLAGLLCVLVLVDLGRQIISGAGPAISHYGLRFLGRQTWAPNFNQFGAAVALYGTAISSLMALLIAVPLAAGIAIYLALLAPPPVKAVVGPMVEMLAAIPSVILGLWGIIVLAPFLQRHVEPALHGALGFLPIFGPVPTTGLSLFTAGVILAIMVLPIIASLSRDLFLTVPRELQDGASALGATRWEVIRGVVLPTTVSGVAAATVLGLGRALGEAIAVTQVVGDGSGIHTSWFAAGQTLSSRIANDFSDIQSPLHQASLFYLAVILLVFAVTTNLAAQAIANRFGAAGALAG